MSYPNVTEQSGLRKAITLPRILDMRAKAEKIAVLTCYDASFASLLDRCEVDAMLVGDSLGMVLQGHGSTLPVTLHDMAYHVGCVARAKPTAWLIGDLPFASYHESPAQAYASAAELVRNGAQMIKIEGGRWLADTVRFIVERGIPVCAHLGLTPQSVHALGGYRVQGKSSEAAARLRDDALALQDAGAQMLVLEMVTADLAQKLTEELVIPTIGIGAGAGCSGQVLVLHDMLGIYPGKPARFVRNFMEDAKDIESAVRDYVKAVKSGTFPAAQHTY